MDTKKTRYTFMEFVKEYSIRIPLIQRDYVQGHDFTDKHKLEKRQEFIHLLMNALKSGHAYHVDFIYGSSIQNKATHAGKIFFIPLDPTLTLKRKIGLFSRQSVPETLDNQYSVWR